tara:strand:+ start:180 stop:413 length:234 start_codon:yes stop_codon:yes gene_type:complete
MKSKEDKLIEIIKEALEVESPKLEDNLNSYDSWDSLGRLSLIALIDEYFDIQVSDRDFNEFEKVNDILNFITSKKHS